MINAYIGNDQLEKEEALDNDVRAFLGELADDPQSKEVLYADSKSKNGENLAEVIEELCESNSMFSPKRAIIVRNLHTLNKSTQEELAKYLKKPNPDCGLFLEAEKLDKRSVLYKSIPKPKGKKSLISYDTLKSYQMNEWIQKRARSDYNKSIDRASAEYLSDLLGTDKSIINQELKKICDVIGNEKQISYEDIHKNIASQRPISIFELSEPFGMRSPKRFISLLHILLESGEHPSVIVASLFKHCTKLMKVQMMMQKRVPNTEIMKSIGIPSAFVFSKVQKLDAQAPKRSSERYRQVLVRLSDMELATKSGGYANNYTFEIDLMALF